MGSARLRRRAHQARLFALPVALLLGFALVVLLLALCKADFALHAAALVVEIQGHEREAALLDLPDQLVDLVAVQQQLARARGIGIDVRRGLRQRADVRADQVKLAVLDDDVAFLDLGPPGAHGLDLPSFEHESCLVALFDEVVEERFSVVDDAHRKMEKAQLL
ncbi:hypothetical protein PT2222_50356 [Paraburkholderia tropica]